MNPTNELNNARLTHAQVKEQLKFYRETSLNSSLWDGWNHSNIQAIARRNRRLAELPGIIVTFKPFREEIVKMLELEKE